MSDERVVDKVFRIWQLSVLRNQDSFAGTHFADELKNEDFWFAILNPLLAVGHWTPVQARGRHWALDWKSGPGAVGESTEVGYHGRSSA